MVLLRCHPIQISPFGWLPHPMKPLVHVYLLRPLPLFSLLDEPFTITKVTEGNVEINTKEDINDMATVEKFCLLGNGHVSPNGDLLCCPYLTLPSCRTRTSVVGTHCLNRLVSDNCCVLQRIRSNSIGLSKNFATCHWHPPTI